MRAAVVLAIAVCAPGCQLVFELEDVPDQVPHVPLADETLDGAGDLTIPPSMELIVTVNGTEIIPLGVQDQATFDVIRQDRDGPDLGLIRAQTVTIAGTLRLRGNRPIVLLANKIIIETGGEIDASANASLEAGPGGGTTDFGDGRGGDGVRDGSSSHSGGGGGGLGPGAGIGGLVDCTDADFPGGTAGQEVGDREVRVLLQGGGAGGEAGGDCIVTPPVPGGRGGGLGGGAIQLSALESIVIAGRVHANGGGGAGGVQCPPAADGGGSGGGAGGVIYLSAPTIENDGILAANGGGGGGGSDRTVAQQGPRGTNGQISLIAAPFGEGVPARGTRGGNGGAGAPAGAGVSGICGLPAPLAVNTGGGGGAAGRIVLRGAVLRTGDISPSPTEIPQ